MAQVSINDIGSEFIEKINDGLDVTDFVGLKIDEDFSLPSTRDQNIYVWNGTGESGEIGAPASSSYGTTLFKVQMGMALHLTATNGSLKTFRWAFTNGYPTIGSDLIGGEYIASTTSVDVEVTSPVDGYLCCSFGNGNFADIALVTNVFVADFAKELIGDTDTKNNDNKSSLPIDGVIAANRKTDWTTESSTTKSCTSVMLVPYDNCTLDFTLPTGVSAYVRYGNIISGSSTSSLSSALTNGSSFVVPVHTANICIIFDGEAQAINTAIGSGDIRIEYSNETPNVVAKNIGCETYTKAVMYKAVTTPANSYLHNIPVFAHISDIHGDLVRMKNCLDYCKYLGVDAILNTGDVCCNKGSDGFNTYNKIVTDFSYPTLVCVGNHDGWYPSYGALTQNEIVNQDLIAPNAIALGYSLPSSSDYDEAPTYYYRDFATQKIRVIALNEYESGLAHWAYVGRISQKQINWLISTLASTPANYAVLLIYHASMFPVDKIADNAKFYNETFDYGQSYDSTKYITGDPIGAIIDAFIGKTSASGSYTQTNNGTSETINWSADFSSLNSGVEFIAHLTGHTHRDYIGLYHGTTQRQVMLSITTGQSLYGFTHTSKANFSELPRGGQGAVEDAFNIYGIDRTAGEIRIARVGANMTSRMTPRDYMIIAYK